VRLHFVVRSDAGIADVQVHDADTGVIRRFLGNGAKELARDFEVVNDRQHYLTLEVTDTAGKRALSWYLVVYSYKAGFFRCGDNLNTLCGSGFVFHPDRNQMIPLDPVWENGMDYSLVGYDSGSYLCPMPTTNPPDTIQTDHGVYPDWNKEGMVGKILDVTLGSSNIQIATQRMTKVSQNFDTETRLHPVLRQPDARPGAAGLLPAHAYPLRPGGA